MHILEVAFIIARDLASHISGAGTMCSLLLLICLFRSCSCRLHCMRARVSRFVQLVVLSLFTFSLASPWNFSFLLPLSACCWDVCWIQVWLSEIRSTTPPQFDKSWLPKMCMTPAGGSWQIQELEECWCELTEERVECYYELAACCYHCQSRS